MPGEKLLKTLERAWNALLPLRVPMAVMGGIAVSVFEHARSTRDVDILIRMERDEVDRALEALARVDIQARRSPVQVNVGGQWMVLLAYRPAGEFYDLKLDLLLADNDYQKEALSRRIPVQLPGCETSVFILSCEDLIIHKLHAGRIIYWADCAQLLRANRRSLDFNYLEKWLSHSPVKETWSQVWQESFPDETAPI